MWERHQRKVTRTQANAIVQKYLCHVPDPAAPLPTADALRPKLWHPRSQILPGTSRQTVASGSKLHYYGDVVRPELKPAWLQVASTKSFQAPITCLDRHVALLCCDFPREGIDLQVPISGDRRSLLWSPANRTRNEARSLWVFWSIKSKLLQGYNFGFKSQSLDCVRGFSELWVNESPLSAPASLQREATEKMISQVGRVCGRFCCCLLDARRILAEEKGIQAALWV